MRRRWIAIALLVVGCRGSEDATPADDDVIDSTLVDSASDTKGADTRREDTTLVDSIVPDSFVAPDTRVPDTGGADAPCVLDPSSHIDCLSTTGGAACVDGKVWQGEHGYRPACTSGAWPGPGPMCTDDTPAYVCTEGCASLHPPDRYSACFPPYSHAPSEMYASLCNEKTFRSPGDACTEDAQCRPSATSDALKCDATSGTCVVAPRPAAPSGYGASCGLDASSVAPAGEQIVPGATCAICHVDYAGSGCVMQACSMPCVFDEDCPDGSVCVCGVGGTSGLDAGGGPAWSFCAAITDRTTTTGRTAWLKCP